MAQAKGKQHIERYLGPLWLIWGGSVKHLAWQILGLNYFNLEYMLLLDSGCACVCLDACVPLAYAAPKPGPWLPSVICMRASPHA